MSMADLTRKTGKFAVDNSPHILTALAVTGVATTAYFTGKATFKAARLIQEADQADAPDFHRIALSDKERMKSNVELTWKLYVPAIGTGVMTIVCIVAANRIGTRRAAAVASAYAFSQKAFDQYREKVVEKIGDKKAQVIDEELAQDTLKANPVENTQIIITGEDESLCYDKFTGRYFMSSVNRLRKAENEVNNQVNNCYYTSLSEFYDRIGLEPTQASDAVGWNVDRLMELRISPGMASNDKPCLHIEFAAVPIHGFARVH